MNTPVLDKILNDLDAEGRKIVIREGNGPKEVHALKHHLYPGARFRVDSSYKRPFFTDDFEEAQREFWHRMRFC